MKINVEVDISPEELRRFMGLPDVQGLNSQMMESFTDNLTSSQDQQQEFVKNLIAGSLMPWQNFFAMMGANATPADGDNKNKK